VSPARARERRETLTAARPREIWRRRRLWRRPDRMTGDQPGRAGWKRRATLGDSSRIIIINNIIRNHCRRGWNLSIKWNCVHYAGWLKYYSSTNFTRPFLRRKLFYHLPAQRIIIIFVHNYYYTYTHTI